MTFVAGDAAPWDVDALLNNRGIAWEINIPRQAPFTPNGSRPAALIPIPAGMIKGGDRLELDATFSKLSAGSVGWSHSLRIGTLAEMTSGAANPGVGLSNSTLNASARFATIAQYIDISPDMRWGFTESTSAMGVAELNQGTLQYLHKTLSSTPLSFNARNRSNIPFVTYGDAASRSLETLRTDFQSDLYIASRLSATADEIELTGLSLRCRRPSKLVWDASRVNVYGDSITEGAGASVYANSWTNRLRRIRRATPVEDYGLAGQRSAEIVNRLAGNNVSTPKAPADPTAKECRVILPIGTNDFDANIGNSPGPGPGWFAAIKSEADRAAAYMGHNNWFICTPYRRGAWAVNDANDTALQYVIAQLIATYGAARVLDWRAVIDPATDLTGDGVHPNDTGHNKLAVAVDAKMTALGWN